ncbi:MAG TPA: hypothetical protein PLD59_15865 [Tepidisphaeraceae bacterium]|nr:hypothetical protein [Tepidisphaeraceae bacterium]
MMNAERQATKRQSDEATKENACSFLARSFPASCRNPRSLSLLPPAFTLVELIISIGLVLIIMLGVNFVFKMTSDTITAGQALNSAVRDHRAAQAVLQDDFSKYAPDGPALLLRSQTKLAFRNRADQDGDSDGDPSTIDIDGDGLFTSAGEIARPALPRQRSYRQDVFSYFAKGKFRRATGGDVGRNSISPGDPTRAPDAPLVSDMSANEAWIWYGHLVLPNNDGLFYLSGTAGPKTKPGDGNATSNPNNFFASQWTLGRLAHLLVEPYDDGNAANGAADVVLDKYTGSAQQVFIGRDPTEPLNSVSGSPLTPASSAYYQKQAGATVSRPSAALPIQLRDSRYDLVGTSISGYRAILNQVLANVANPLTYDWYSRMMLSERFETNPALVRPVKAGTVAAQAPIFMQNCTQFIVEYAGDFLAQDNNPVSSTYGDITGAFNASIPSTDGEVDFVVLNRGTPAQRKVTRWYGLPRDTNGDASVPRPLAAANANNCPDVLPLRDLLTLGGGGPATFEKDVNTDLPTQPNYATGMTFGHSYTCAWGPSDNNRPRLIRLVVTTDEPAGRLPDGQTYEYVFALPPAE